MTFSNPITGGQGTLVRPSIKSPNYIPGTSGWSINRVGDAEFNQLTIRGTFYGTNFILNSAGLFFYSGTPAAGNLVGSWSQNSSTDTFGNHYVAGVCTYDQTNGKFAQFNSGSVLLGNIVSGVPDSADAATMTVAGAAMFLLSLPDIVNGFPNPLEMELVSGQSSVTGLGSGEPYLSVQAQGSTPASIHVSGALIKTTNSGTLETWHPAPAAATGWNMVTLQYRLDGEDNVIWSGRVDFTGTSITAAGAQIVSATAVPAKFRPAADRRLGITHSTSTGVLKNVAALLIVRADGFISVSWGDGMTGTTHDAAGNANGDRYEFTVSAPLGNLP